MFDDTTDDHDGPKSGELFEDELAELGLLDFEESDREKRPKVWYDEITVELPLGSDERGDTDAPEV